MYTDNNPHSHLETANLGCEVRDGQRDWRVILSTSSIGQGRPMVMLMPCLASPFGCPQRFHADQGANFESSVVQEICQMYGEIKSHTIPYHPEGNRICERFNRTLDAQQKANWTEYIQELVFLYNNSIHSST